MGPIVGQCVPAAADRLTAVFLFIEHAASPAPAGQMPAGDTPAMAGGSMLSSHCLIPIDRLCSAQSWTAKPW